MTPVTITDRIKQKIAEVFGVEADTLQDSTRLRSDLQADDLDLVEVEMTLEEAFHFQSRDGEMDYLNTVGDVVKYVQQKVGGG